MRESLREPEGARESQSEPERAGQRAYIAGWHKLQLCIWEADYKREAGHTSSMPQHCFVEKQLNTTLFCRETLKYGTFCRKTLKYAL